MSKSIYEEALEIIKQRINTIRINTKIGSRTIADKENAVLLNHIEYNLNKLCELIEKQEKLLELYKLHYKLVPFRPGLGDNAKTVIDNCQKIEQILKELENESN